jgi:hypothetical protein
MSNGSFRKGPDPRRNTKQILRAGHPHRWQPGQSGNPTGRPAALVEFEARYAEALVNEGSAEELARMIWKAARKGESWAVLKLSERFEWAREHPADDRELRITVEYVKRSEIAIAGAASWAGEGDSGGEAVQRGLLRPALGQDEVGDGPSDPSSAGGEAGGVVQPKLSKLE